jgi:hypothetical protein
MGRILGILAIVVGVWIGAEVYTKGVDGAFGGIFAGAMDPLSTYESTPDGRSPVQNITDNVRDNIERGADRTRRGVERGR